MNMTKKQCLHLPTLCQRLIQVAVAKQPSRCYVPEGAKYTPSNLVDVVPEGSTYTPSNLVDVVPGGATYTPSNLVDVVPEGATYTPNNLVDVVPEGATYTPSNLVDVVPEGATYTLATSNSLCNCGLLFVDLTRSVANKCT